jgi:WD40 repeat protein
MARVFISYRHVDPDAQIARALYTRLSDADHEVFIDAADIPLGALWDKQIARNVELAEYFVPLVSASYLYSKYILDRELAPAAGRLQRGHLAGFLQINLAYDGEPPAALKDVLSSIQFVKWRGDADTARVLDEVVRALPSARSLLKGMRSYEAADADRFAQMGRAREIDEAIALLRSRPRQPVLLHGVSGAGKSSFIRAGLIPRLGQAAADVVELTEDTVTVLGAMPKVDVLFLDQFEQTLIRMAQGAEPSASFAAALTAWLEGTPSTVVFCIRDEYRTAFDTMLPAIARRCAPFPVVPFSPDVGAEVLGQLLEDARVAFEPAFARQLCDELAEGVPRTTLPALLQLIVQYCRARGEPLTAAAWDRLAERGAIFRDHVRQTVIEALPRRISELRACETLEALTAGDVKAAAKTLGEISSDSRVDADTARATLDMAALPHARVVRTEKDADGQTRYRLIHDLFVPTIDTLVRDARASVARVRTLAVIATLAVLLATAGGFWYRSYRQGLEMQRREARAIAGQIAAAATTPPNVESSGLRRGAAMAIEAISRFDALGESSFTATTALRAGLRLLPRHARSLPLKQAEFIGFCRDGRHVLVRNEEAVWSWSPRGSDPATRIADVTARTRVALSPDRSSLAIASKSESGPVTLRLVPFERAGEAWTLEMKAASSSAEPTGLNFSADNSRVAIAAGEAILVDLAARREMSRLVGLVPDALLYVFFVGDSLLLGANEDADHTLWELRGPPPSATRVPQGPLLEARGLILLPTGKAQSVATVSREKAKPLLSVLQLDSADLLDYHETAQLLAIADYNAVSVYGLAGQQLATLQHTSNVNSIAFSHNGSEMVTASRDGTARIWDARSGREVARVADGPYDDARVSPDGRTLITVGFAGLDSWEVPPQPFYRRLSDTTSGGPVTFSVDGSLVARGESNRDNAHFAVATMLADGSEAWRLPHKDRVNQLAFSPDGRYLATAEYLGIVRLWDLQTRRELWSFKASDPEMLVFAHDSQQLAVASYFEAIVLDTATGKQRLLRKQKGRVRLAGFIAGDRELVMAGDANPIEIVRIADGTVVRETKAPIDVFGGALGGNGRLAIYRANDVRVIDLSNWAVLASFDAPDTVESAAFTADGRHLALGIGSTSSQVPIYAAQIVQVAPTALVDQIAFRSPVTSVAFGAGDRYLAVSSGDILSMPGQPNAGEPAGATVWTWRAADLRAMACERLTQSLGLAEWRSTFGAEACHAVCPNLPACK